MSMDADRQDIHDAMCRHEQALQDGKSDDYIYKTGVLVDLCRAVKKIVATDFIKFPELQRHCEKMRVECCDSKKKQGGIFNMSIGSSLAFLGTLFGVIKLAVYLIEMNN